MSDFTTAYNAQNAAYQEIWDKAQDAMDSLKLASAGGYVDESPGYMEVADLNFDPGTPTSIKFNTPISINTILQNIDNYIKDISQIQAPTFPDSTGFKMEDHQMWNDAFSDKIKNNLSDYLDSMGIPDVKYQDAIFKEEYDRNLLTLNDLYDLADAKTGARGFSYTNSYGHALKIDAQNKYQFDKTQVSRTISKTVTEWARQNYQFAAEKGIAFESAQMDFTYKYCTASVEIYKSMIVAELEKFKAEIIVIEAPVNLLIKELEASLEYTKIDAEIAKTNETLKQARSTIEIQEALAKYGHDASLAGTKLGQRLHSLEAVAQHAAGLAASNTNSIIGYTKS